MRKKLFKDTTIAVDFSESVKSIGGISPGYVEKLAVVIFGGTSMILSILKNTTVSKAIVFKSLNNAFIVGAKIEYIPNQDNPSDTSAGRWDYTWTFYEDDLKDAECFNVSESSLVRACYKSFAKAMYNASWADTDNFISGCLLFLEMIKQWLNENADKEGIELVVEDAFSACSLVNEDGEIELGISPASKMKILIKNDTAIQEN